VRHVLLLALHRALVLGGIGGGGGGKGTRAGSKGGASASSKEGSAGVPVLARGLVSACFPELRATLPLLHQADGVANSQGREQGGASDAPLAHWQVSLMCGCLSSEQACLIQCLCVCVCVMLVRIIARVRRALRTDCTAHSELVSLSILPNFCVHVYVCSSHRRTQQSVWS
jgi:hypothetical protein